MNDIIYFELNNWVRGQHYPDAEPFITWMSDDLNIKFNDEKWVKEQKLCVTTCFIDMSQNFCITAAKEWVEKNCPELLTKYKKFIVSPEEDGNAYGRFDAYFLPYEEDNYGVKWIEDSY